MTTTRFQTAYALWVAIGIVLFACLAATPGNTGIGMINLFGTQVFAITGTTLSFATWWMIGVFLGAMWLLVQGVAHWMRIHVHPTAQP